VNVEREAAAIFLVFDRSGFTFGEPGTNFSSG
jgi:hypothetical protein